MVRVFLVWLQATLSDLPRPGRTPEPSNATAQIKLSALAADDAGRGDKENGGGEDKEDPKSSKDSDHLSAVPNDRSSAVTKLSLAVPTIVVTQQEVVIQRSKAVPAEDVFTPFAHHLSTASVPLDGHAAHRTPLDVVIAVVRQKERIHRLPSTLHQGSPVLSTGESRVPGCRAETAKLFVTGGA